MPETDTVLRFERHGERLFIDPSVDLNAFPMPTRWRVFASYLQERGLHWPAGGVEPDGLHVPRVMSSSAEQLQERLRKDIEWYDTLGADHATVVQTLREAQAALTGGGDDGDSAVSAEILSLHNEVDCRIEHGADSSGHLEYVRGRLAALIESGRSNPGSPLGGDGDAAPEVTMPDSMSADTREAVELLGLWYGRWQGFVVGTPARMHLRTRALLDKYGVHVHKDVKQR